MSSAPRSVATAIASLDFLPRLFVRFVISYSSALSLPRISSACSITFASTILTVGSWSTRCPSTRESFGTLTTRTSSTGYDAVAPSRLAFSVSPWLFRDLSTWAGVLSSATD